MPAWSALFAVFLLKERISLRIAVSLVLSLIAVALIVAQEAAVRAAPFGTLLTLLAAISFGIGTVLGVTKPSRRFAVRTSSCTSATVRSAMHGVCPK